MTLSSAERPKYEREVDVDSVFLVEEDLNDGTPKSKYIEIPPGSRSRSSNNVTFSSSATSNAGTSSILESFTPKDIEELAQLLKPAIIGHTDTDADDDDHDEMEFDFDLKPAAQKEEAALMSSMYMSKRDIETFFNEKEKEEIEWHNPYGESTYSLFYLCPVNSFAFWYAAFVYFLQITTILLTMIDVIDWDGTTGLNLPPMVDVSVTIAQGVALFQAVAFQSDLIGAVSKFKEGFHHEVLKEHPGATYATWFLSCTAELFAGSLLLVTIFVLIMQVDTVLDIMLNFAALEFMANIDDVAFSLAKTGFIGNRLQGAANNVATFRVRKRPASDQGFLQRSWKAGVFFLVLLILVAGWVTIVAFRTSGQYMCNTIIVNMGDEFVPSLGTFNGLYDLDSSAGSGLEWRAEYVERRSLEIDTPGRGIFGYCSDIKAWTFRVESRGSNEKGDPCDWIARSSETDAYDITEAVASPWFVRDDSFREVVLEPFSVFCFDCTKEDAEGSDDCGGKGTCSNAVCDCEDGWYGLRCEFVSPCPWITIDARTDKFASTRDWADNFQSIDLGNGALVEAHHRPVYIHEYSDGEYDVVMFTGGRWALTSSVFLPQAGRIPSNALTDSQDDVGNDIGNYFKHSFHGYKGFSTNFSVAFLSDFMEIGTDRDLSSPVGFAWYHAIAKERTTKNENQGIGNEISTEFLCRLCDESSNPCLYDGQCNAGECVCSLDSFGSLCEIPPVRNGHCDPFFNLPEFKMDGGDCCESSCASTSQYVCGAEEDGYVSTGYYYCEQPKNKWQSSLLNGAAGSFSGYSMDLSMGSIAVSEILQDRVRIYDKVGSSWVLRDTIIGDAGSRFGAGVLGLSSGPFNVVSNPSFKAPLTVAVQDAYRRLQIYKCNFEGCTRSQEFPLVFAFALSKDGTVLATSLLVAAGEAPNVIRVYEAQEGLFEFRADLNVTRNGSLADVSSLSLSGDGSTLAVQTQMKEFDTNLGFSVATNEYIVVMAWSRIVGSYNMETEIRFESQLNTLGYELSVALNQDGTVLAHGFPNCQGTQLHVHARNNDGNWIARAAPAMNTTGCIYNERPEKNNALSLSGDGITVAFRVGTKVRVLVWESKTESWDDVSDPFPSTHYPIALSSNGKELAIGAPEDGIGGVTAVYSLPGRKECPAGMSLLRLSLTLDRLPGDVVWNLVNNSTGEILFEQESYPQEYTFATILEETCVPADSCYVFTIYSNDNRGLLAPGQYAIFMDGVNVAQGTFSGLFGREEFGSCASCPEGTELFSMMMLTCGPMELVLLKVINQGESGIALHADSTLDGDYDGTVYETCNEHHMSVDCAAPFFSISYSGCLDTTECYGVQVKSQFKHTAYLELVLGKQRVNARPNAVCGGETFFVGQKDKCLQEDWLNRKLQMFAN
ncbi:expressed unknown protein [Seminavis robusta]|uniref:EGF-like domain-containing protein n=1 Tax=Seminavis robusta TaxID=568900 RepID=A0A9N8DTS8_9STRA|nr:expressed unknown protein [Seminavis robusta]|eukprot:Sro284_g107900.1 n/a (1398) ;mRNA; r:24294-28735